MATTSNTATTPAPGTVHSCLHCGDEITYNARPAGWFHSDGFRACTDRYGECSETEHATPDPSLDDDAEHDRITYDHEHADDDRPFHVRFIR